MHSKCSGKVNGNRITSSAVKTGFYIFPIENRHFAKTGYVFARLTVSEALASLWDSAVTVSLLPGHTVS